MRLQKPSLLSILLVLSVAFFLSACSHIPADTTETGDDSDTIGSDEDTGVVDDSDKDVFEEGEDTTTDEDVVDEEEPVEGETGEEVTETGGTTGSISGKFCYPTSPIPANLRAYVKNAKTGYYFYISSGGRSTWTISELEPAMYNVYLAGPDGSGLEEGRYLNADNSWRTITLNAGNVVTGVEPCDFDF